MNPMDGMCNGVAILAAYLVGAIPIGLVLARIKGVDIRKVGSGNIGATNVYRSVGKGWGIATFAGDAIKGFVPTFFFPLLVAIPCAWLGLACGCAAIAGHNWPLYLGFKGGKGVSTSAGMLVGLAPAAAGIGLLAWLVLVWASRIVSVASMGAALVVPAAGWWLYAQDGLLLPAALSVLGLLVVFKHRGNLKRLLAGTEPRIWGAQAQAKQSDSNKVGPEHAYKKSDD